MRITEHRIAQLCRCVLVVALALPVYLGITHGLLDLEQNPVLRSALAGAFLIHMWTRPRPSHWAPAVAIAFISSAAYAWLHHGFAEDLGAAPATCAAFLGLGSLLVLATQSVFAAALERRQHRKTLLAAAAFPYFSFVIALALNLTSALHPRVYDLWLFAFDEALKVRASFLIGHLVANSNALRVAGVLAYESLPLVICWLLALELRSPERFAAGIVRVFVTAGLAGVFLYQFLPAVGPVYVFGAKFPDQLPAMPNIAIQPILLPRVARNAMPSVHFACALLVWWNTAAFARVWRVLAAAFVASTLLATLGFGEHYLVDLVVAVPFALAVQSACLKVGWYPAARSAFWGGAILTAGWIGALRLGVGQSSFALSWCAVVVTLILTLRWKLELRRPSRLTAALHGEDVAEIPDHQKGVPVVDPAHQIRTVQEHAQTGKADGDDLGNGHGKTRAEMQQRANERAGLRDAELEPDQGGQQIQNLQV
ncbi:MAG: phosphatase PAP2 family protein [Acidobacteriia bacterium]|nr:phosphatase PAP2 family protein [Terriglobia bacterium]